MAGRTIHIVEGMKMYTARWSLKMELEVFGKIDVCHMGDRFNQKEHPAWVKFNTREGAQKAMESMAQGRVLCNGEVIRGEWRTEVALPTPMGDILDAPELNLTSRDIYDGGRDRDRDRRRARSRSRSRRSRRRSRSRRSRRNRSRSRRGGNRSRSRRNRKRSESTRRSRSKGDRGRKDKEPVMLAVEDEAEVALKAENGACPLGHGLVPVIAVEENAVKCDICDREQSGELNMLRCKQCAYHLCKTCVELKVLA